MEFIQNFKNFLLLQKPTPSRITVKNYVADVKHFISWYESFFSKTFQPQEITPSHIHSFKQEKAAIYSVRSIERHLSSLRKFFYALKLQGSIARSPFDEIPSLAGRANQDPWRLKEFKDFLYVYNASRLTIKNYIIDVKQFVQWVEKRVSRTNQQKAALTSISPDILEAFKLDLIQNHAFSPTSINRKLSSLRKYFTWAREQGYLSGQIAIPDNLNNNTNTTSTNNEILPGIGINTYRKISKQTIAHENSKKPFVYSKFPPLRLLQKIGKGVDLGVEFTVITPLTKVAVIVHKQIWKLQGKKLFIQDARFSDTLSQPKLGIYVKNIQKAIYAPHAISLKYFPWYRKAWHHARNTRPSWYRKYHSYALAHYFNWAILIIFCTTIGFAMYNTFVDKPQQNPTLAATAPPRILSFQGRLTDSADTPITASTNLRFAIYLDATASGSALLWQEVNSVIPDKNGVFSVLLGKGTTIPQSLFANNQNLYLGITVGTTDELTPRQQLATVAYAANAETLQGMPPITQSGAGTTNVILALNSSGNLSIGASTTFQSTTGQFAIAGNTVAFSTNPGSNGNITFTPDGTGVIDFQKPLVNSTTNGNIGNGLGALEVDDLFAVLATSSASAVVVNQTGSGALISASSSGVSKFTVGTSGDITSANYTTAGGVLYTDGTGLFLQTGSGGVGDCLISNGGSAPTWSSCGTGSNFWTLDNTQGTLSSINSTLDVFFGGTSTTSANFAFINNAAGTPTASIAGNLTLNSAGVIQTTRNQGLTIGGNSTGNIILSPLNGTGNITIAGMTAGVVHSNNAGVLSSAAINLAGGATEVSGILPLANGGTNNNLTADNGGVVYSDASKLQILAHSPTVGACLVSGGSGAPTWGNCTGGGGLNWWNMNQGTIFPVNTTLDFVIGGTSTGSAKFAFINVASGTPTASISGNVTLNSAGIIQTTNNQALTLGGNTTGNIILSPLNGSGNVTINGKINNSLIPTVTDTYDLGTSALEWNNLYVKNVTSTGNIFGFFQRTSGVISPTHTSDDFALGGTATGSAKFQISGTTGNATTAGTLTFDGTGNLIQTTNNQGLIIGGNTTGNISLSPLNGAGNVTINGSINSNLTPSANNTYDLGSNPSGGNQWNNLYAQNIFQDGQPVIAAWQRNAGVLSPLQITNDLAIGGTSTGSAVFQVFANTGNATMGGTLTLNNVGSIQTTNNQGLTIGGATTGNITLSPLNGAGTVTIAGLANGVVHSTGGVLSTTTVALGSEVSGVLPIANGGTNTNSIGSAGSVAYSNGTSYAFTAVGSLGDCLVSQGSSSPIWGSCSAAAGASNYWTLDTGLGALYPINSTLDFFVGGNSTASANFAFLNNAPGSGTPTASIAGNLTLNSAGIIQTTRNQPLTIGGNSTGNIILSPLNGTGSVTVDGNKLITTASNFDLLNTNATTINFGAAATTLNIGNTAGTTTLNGNLILTGTANLNGDVNLGNATGDTITAAGRFGSSLVPTATDTYDLGSNSLEWNNLYVKNIISGGSIAGFFQRNLGVLSPTNITDDLALGGTATSTAKFQIFANTGNATTAGTLTFTNGGSQIQTTSNQPLTLGGNSTGGITLSPNNGTGTVTINGTKLTTTALSFDLVNTAATTINFAGAATTINIGAGTGTTTVNNALTVAGTASLNGDVNLGNATGDTITAAGRFGSSLVPTATDTYDLGAVGLEWNNLYVKNVISGGTISGFWQRLLGVLSPTNITDDLALGGTSTGSAKFQIFANSGNATTAGNLTFNGNGTIQTTNNLPLVLGGNSTGGITLSPNNGTGTVTVNGKIASSLIPSATDTYDLGSNSLEWNNLYVKNIISGGTLAGFFQRNLGLISPANITDDFAVGGAATSSAKFQIFGLTGNATTAGTLTFTNGGSQIQTTSNQTLTLGGDTTGGIVLSPNNGTGTVTINGLGTGVVHSTGGVLGTSAVNLQTEVSGILPLANGGTNASLIADAGGIVYSDSSSLQILAHATSSNKCLLSGGTGAPTWGDCTLGGGSNWWSMNAGALFPINSTLDFFVGGNSTASANFAFLNNTPGSGTPTASISGNLTLNSAGVLQTTNNQGLTIGGNSTGNITLSPLNGNGSVTIDGNKLVTTASNFDLLNTTATTINFGAAATTLTIANNALTTTVNIGGTSGTTTINNSLAVAGAATLNGNVTLGDTNTDLITPNGIFAGSLIPQSNTINLGSATNYYGNAYITNLFPASTSTYQGFLQRALGVLSPTNITDDFALGGTSTGSAKFQIFANTGNATTAGNLTFSNAGSIQTTSDLPLTLGGTTTGNVILSPNNGTGSVTVNGTFNSNLTPTAKDTYDLGSPSLEWNNLYVKNIITGGTLLGTWQRNLGVLAPLNITDDVAVGGTATTSAKFQIFGLSGNATTAGTLTFDGTGSLIQTTNNQGLTIGGNTTGNITLSPLNGAGSVTIDGNKLITTASSFDLLNTTATTINFGGAATTANFVTGATTLHLADAAVSNNLSIGGTVGGTTTINNALAVTGATNLNGNVTLGDTNTDLINPIGIFSGSLIPQSIAINLGSASNYFGNAYLTNAFPSASSVYQGFLQRILGVLSPTNITDDFAVGGTGTGSAKFQIFANTGNATTTGTLTFNGNGVIQTTNNTSLTLGGNSTGNIILSPNNGTGIITINGKFNSSLIPTATNTYDLGSASLQWNNVYANNIFQNGQPLTQEWQRNLGVVAPLNITDDLAIGGTATSTAKFQVFGLSGNATTAGTLTFTNGGSQIQTTSSQTLTLGGNTTGGITLSPNNGNGTVTVNGTKLNTTASSFDLFNTVATLINFGGAATTVNIGAGTGTTTVNNALTVTGTLTANNTANLTGNVTLGTNSSNNITANGSFNSSLIPSASNAYDLGQNPTTGNQWNNLYAQNIYQNGEPVIAAWQRNLGVLAPLHVTDDLAIGGTATGSAKFQIFGLTGNATTSGNLTFAGTTATNLIAARDMAGITIGDTQTGPIIFNGGNVGIGTTNPTAPLHIGFDSSSTPGLLIGGGNDLTNYLSLSGGRTLLGYDLTGGNAVLNAGSNKGLAFYVNGTNGAFTSGREALNISALGFVGINTTSQGNGALVVNQTNTSGLGDIIAASASGATKFIVTNGGIVQGASFQDFNNTSYLLDPASTGNSLLVAGTAGIGTLNPLSLSGLDIEKNAQGNAALVVANLNTVGDLFTASNSAGTKFTIANSGTISKTGYSTSGGILFATSTGAISQTAAGNLGECLQSTAGSTPVWGTCGTGGNGSYWVLNAATLYPVNSTVDMFVGGSATASAKFAVLHMAPGSGTPVASVSSGLNGTALFMSADGSIQTATANTLTLGGNRTGNIDLTPQGGAGSVNINGVTLNSGSPSFDLFDSPVTLTFAEAATSLTIGANTGTTTFRSPTVDDSQSTVTLFNTPTTLNLGNASGTTTVEGALTVNGNTTLGTNTSNTITSNGLYNTDILPFGNGNYNLGSSSHYFNTVYANNFVAPVGGGQAGYWSLSNDVLFPSNTFYDLTVGGTATSSAAWQVFSQSIGVDTAGTATSSGGLSFRGATTNVNLLNGSVLKVNTSLGGDEGATTQLELDNNGDLTLGGANIKTTSGAVALFNTTATNISFAGAATTLNLGFSGTNTDIKGNVTLGTNVNTNSIFLNAKFSSSLLPTSNGINIGASGNEFGNGYFTNLFLTGQYGGFWQRFGSVVAPFNIANDLAIGGNATSSALFQVFGTSGTASTSGQLSFKTNSQVNLLNNAALGFYNSVGGDAGITAANPALYIASNGNIGIGTNSTQGLVTLASSGTLQIGQNTDSSYTILDNNDLKFNRTNNSYISQIAGGTLRMGVGSISANGNGLTITPANSFGINTTQPGNAALAVNQAGLSGLGDLFTASASGTPMFTIAYDGTIKNSLIPNVTDFYNLGSDPTLPGGKEWDTLYVRQIVTPSNGGLAGFWQLSNNGVLAPANTTNDLVIGGNSTASAHFQVFGSGSGVGTIAATLNDPKVNSNAGVLAASTKIINIASTDHTYMTLDNKDLTIGGHKNMQSISNVQKVYIYDTSKDTDGGAWTNDERAQASSWYNETATAADSCVIGTNTRCGQQAFPKKAIIVVSSNNTTPSGSVYIFDAKDNSLWMTFNQGSGSTEQMIGPSTNSQSSAVEALNGKIYVGKSRSAGGVYVLDFIHDTSYKYNSSGYSQASLSGSNAAPTIANRNTTISYQLAPNATAKLLNNQTPFISVNILPDGRIYLAAGGAGGTNGSVALIDDTDKQLVANFGPASITSTNLWLTSKGTLYALICNSTCGNYALKIKYNANLASGNNQLFDEVYANVGGSTNYGATTNDNNTFTSLSMTAGPASSSATFVPANAQNAMYVTEGTSFVDGVSDTVYLAATGSNGSVMAFNLKKGDPSNAAVKYYNGNYITEDMVGDIRGMWPLDETSGNLLDASVKGITLTASSSGVTYSTSGVRGTALTFDGSSGYLSCSDANCGGTSKTDSGGTVWSVGAWIKTTSSNVQGVISKFNNNVNGSYMLRTSSGHVLFTVTSGQTLQGVRTVNDGNWHYIVGTYDGSTIRDYVDGQLDGTMTYAGTIPDSTADFAIGAYPTSNFYGNWFNGSIDEPFVAADTLTPSEIAHMYQVGYRALQNHSSKTIRGGAVVSTDGSQKLFNGNSNVSAVAANMQNGQIYVGTQGGGTSVIGMDSDTITDLYNSSINTSGDTGTTWSASANNNFVQTIATGQSYGTGTALVIGTSNAGSGNTWMETQDTSLKEFMADSYNPFGTNLTQSNLNVDSVLRVTNQISTRLDNMAFGATSSAMFADAFRVDSNGDLLSRSLVNSNTAMQFQDAAGNDYLTINTAAGPSDTAFNFFQPGSGDIMIASTSAGVQFQLTNSGILKARSFQDLDNTSYFIDPAASGLALDVNGSVSIATTSASSKINFFGSSTDEMLFYGNGQPPRIHFRNAVTTTDNWIEQDSGGNLAFQIDDGTEAMVIKDTNGDVGIGTTNPVALLQVASGGNTATSYTARFQSSGSTSGAGGILFDQNNTDSFKLYTQSTSGSSGQLIWSYINESTGADVFSNILAFQSGNVGISTATPDKTLQVAGTVHISSHDSLFTTAGWGDALQLENANVIHFKKGTSTTSWALGSTTDGKFRVISSTADDNSAAASYPLVIDTAGNVGIGSTSPAHTLDVNGDLFTENAGNLGVQVTSTGQEFFFLDGTNNKAGIRLGGTGTTITNGWDIVAPAGTVYVDIDGNGNMTAKGCVKANGGGTLGTCLSDQRLKTNVQPLPSDILSGLLQLQPVSYNWRTDVPLLQQDPTEYNPNVTNYGFIAQQVESVLPQLAVQDLQDGYMGVNYGLLQFYMLQGMKEQQAEIASNSAQLASNSAALAYVNLNETGDISINAAATPSADFTVPHYYTIADALGNTIHQMGAFAELAVANLRAGSIQTQQLFTNSLALATANITIAGQSLHDYILNVVQSAGYSNTQVASSNSVKTNIISPLNGGNVALRLTNSGIEVAKDASSSAVASIDNNGNATFSGSLNSENLAVNSDATISGTLHANRIEANEIAGLNAIVGTLSAQNITNVTNIYFATPSGTVAGADTITGSTPVSSINSGALTPQIGYANIASYSGFLAYVPNLSAATATFGQGLISTGTTSLSDTTVSGQLAIGTQLILADNSVNVLGGTFQIQSLAQGDVSFEGGLVAIDTNGNLTVGGNAVFAKNLAANVITPLTNDKDLTFKLGDNSVASGSALATSTLNVQNASGSGVFNIDQLGNVIASGAASIGKLNFNAVQPALAVSDTEVVATGSAGTTAIKAHQTEVTIDNPLVTSKSLIYITPVGQTTYTPYLLRQVGGKSFTVGIPVQQYVDTTFNWLIVN